MKNVQKEKKREDTKDEWKPILFDHDGKHWIYKKSILSKLELQPIEHDKSWASYFKSLF